MIQQDINEQLLGKLALYCKLLLTRIGLLVKSKDSCDEGLIEALASIIYSSDKIDNIQELAKFRKLLISWYNKEIVLKYFDGQGGVESSLYKNTPVDIIKMTLAETPKPELVLLYLCEIARTYDVFFSELSEEKEKSNILKEVQDEIDRMDKEIENDIDQNEEEVVTEDEVDKLITETKDISETTGKTYPKVKPHIKAEIKGTGSFQSKTGNKNNDTFTTKNTTDDGLNELRERLERLKAK